MSFTLFVLLPNEDVCSLRRLPSHSSIRAVRKMLELSAGLPAHIYDLACPDGGLFADDVVLQLDENIWDGYVIRVIFREDWQDLVDALVRSDLAYVMEYCSLDALKNPDIGKVKVKDTKKERGVVALFLASFLGLVELSSALMCAGVDPDSETPFGRTPLFAAMVNDHVHVMELLLSHHATLQSRDKDGTSAIDVAHEHQAKECVRRARRLTLVSRINSAASSAMSGTSARGSGHATPQQHVIRIPTGSSAEGEGRVLASSSEARLARENSSSSPIIADSSPSLQTAAVTTSLKSKPSSSSENTNMSSRPSPRPLFRTTEVFTWENNFRSVSRASSVARTHVRIPVPGVEGISSGRSSRASSTGQRGSWSDTVAMGSGAGTTRRPPVKPSVPEFTITGPASVLNVSPPVNVTESRRSAKQEAEQALNQGTGTCQTSQHNAQEPPARPCSPHDGQGAPSQRETQAPVASLSISVPDSRVKNDCDTSPDSEPEDARCNSPEGKKEGGAGGCAGSRSSPATSSQLARSRRRKQQASWRTVKRRLKLAEDRRKTSSSSCPSPSLRTRKHVHKKQAAQASFEQWLQRKREERQGREDSSSSHTDSSSEAEDEGARSAQNEKAFRDWLKDLKERPHRGPHPFTPASLHRRKSRPLKNLIQVGVVSTEASPDPPAPASYLRAHQQCTGRRQAPHPAATALTSPRHLQEAKRKLEEKRKSFLAAALTYEEWLEHAHHRHQLMQALLRVDADQLTSQQEAILHTRRAPRQISFSQWRRQLHKREAEIREQEKEHMRSPGARYHHDKHGFLIRGDDSLLRSSAAIPHQQWLKRKQQQEEEEHSRRAAAAAATSKNPQPASTQSGAREGRGGGGEGGCLPVSGRAGAWEQWLQHKHLSQLQQLKGRYSGKNGHPQATPRATHC